MLDDLRSRIVAWVKARPDAGRLGRWHQVSPCGAVPLRDGTWSRVGRGQVWRRRLDTRWQYEQDDGFETAIDDLRGSDWD